MTNTELRALSGLLVLSYLLDASGRRFQLPSVVLLIASGIVARQFMRRFSIQLGFVEMLLPVIGTVGLILIVLEARSTSRCAVSVRGSRATETSTHSSASSPAAAPFRCSLRWWRRPASST